MKCRFCGKNVLSINDTLSAPPYGNKCPGNGMQNHIGISDGKNCVYCGRATHITGSKLCTMFGFKCGHSPTGGHCLQ